MSRGREAPAGGLAGRGLSLTFSAHGEAGKAGATSLTQGERACYLR